VIIDTSAVIAILRDEPEATDCAAAIDGSRDPVASRRTGPTQYPDAVREAFVVRLEEKV